MAYTKAFKEQAMRLVTQREYTPTAAARELGIPDNTLNQWLKKAGWRPPASATTTLARASAWRHSKPEPKLLRRWRHVP